MLIPSMRRALVGLLIALTCFSAALGLRKTLSALPRNRSSIELKLARYDALRAPLRTVRQAYLKSDQADRPSAFGRLYRAQYALAPTVLHLVSTSTSTRVGNENEDTYVVFDFRRAKDLEQALDDHRRAIATVGLEMEVVTAKGGVALVLQRRQSD